MTVGILIPIPREFVLTAAASTLAGAELYVYENTTTTPVTLYSDRACTTPAANPIVSVAGFFPRRYMATAQLLTLTLKTTAGSTIHSDDYVSGLQEADADLTVFATLGTSAMSGLLYGLTLSNNGSDATNDIDIAAGVAIDSANAMTMRLATALTKRLDANWTAGTNQGMRYSGASIADTTYGIWLCGKALGADADVYAYPNSGAPSAATVLAALQAEGGGSAYVYVRYIGCIVRASSAIRKFLQDGDRFWWESPPQDIAATNPGTSAVTRALTLPLGVKATAHLLACIRNGSNNSYGLLSSLDAADIAPSSTLYNFPANQSVGGGSIDHTVRVDVRSNTSAQIRSRISASGASDVLLLQTLGWTDRRGRFG